MQIVDLTDWDRVKREAAEDAPIPYDPEDGPYDPNDAEAVRQAWENGIVTHGIANNVRGKQKKPTKQLVPIRLSRSVLDHFKSGGRGWQTRINQALLKVVEEQTQAGAPKT